MSSYDRCPQEFVTSLADVYFHEALDFAIKACPIHLVQFLHERLHWYALFLSFLLVEPDVGNLRIGRGAPGNGQSADLSASEKQGVLDED